MSQPDYPQRIVSLVPSLTELLFDLGLEDRLAGRTRFCVHPEDRVEAIPIIGGTKNPRVEKIRDARPDWVIANKEENEKEHVEQIRQFCKVTVTEIHTIEQALNWIEKLGKSAGVSERAHQLTGEITGLLERRDIWYPMNAVYYIWKDPWMSIGGDTYIHDVMNHWGLTNLLSDFTRYPELPLSDLERLQPELILLSSEPYPFKEKHKEEIKEICPSSRIELVDGEWFSWYGSRMKHVFESLTRWRNSLEE